MKGFKEFVTEALDKPEFWSWSEKSAKRWVAEFEIEDMTYDVNFFQDRKDSEKWSTDFGAGKNRKNTDAGIATGKRHSLKVLATVIDVIKTFVKNKDPDKIEFSATKGVHGQLNRSGTYRTILKTRLPKEYEFVEKSDNDMTLFVIKKKGLEEQRKANVRVVNAVRDGRLKKPSKCERCSGPGPLEGHHPDYRKELEVEWLCKSCHTKHHKG